MSGPLTIMLVAAEASGDVLGAGLARALRRRLGDGVRLVGVGGSAMAAEGIASAFDIAELSILGAVEGARAYRRVLTRVADTVSLAERERPDVAVLIDSWGFTVRVARRLRRALPTIGLVKYVAPQVWASRPGRARVLARSVDLLLSIHAFEIPAFERAGLKTVFVGHRTLTSAGPVGDPVQARRRLDIAPDVPVLLVLPGSRAAEVERLAQPFGEALAQLTRDRPRLQIVVPVAATVADKVRALAADWPGSPRLVEGEAAKRDALASATAAMACSGTAVLELAQAGVPMVVAYRVNALTYLISKLLLRTRFITLFNIAADAEVAPELIQHDCTGPKLARAVGRLLDDRDLGDRQVAAQTLALDRLGRGGEDPSALAAEAVISLARQRGRLPA